MKTEQQEARDNLSALSAALQRVAPLNQADVPAEQLLKELLKDLVAAMRAQVEILKGGAQ